MSTQKPYFIWDYDLTEDDVRRILHSSNEIERLWMIGRILTHASYNDVWKYVTLDEIIRDFSKLKIRQEAKEAWSRALQTWGYHV